MISKFININLLTVVDFSGIQRFISDFNTKEVISDQFEHLNMFSFGISRLRVDQDCKSINKVFYEAWHVKEMPLTALSISNFDFWSTHFHPPKGVVPEKVLKLSD